MVGELKDLVGKEGFGALGILVEGLDFVFKDPVFGLGNLGIDVGLHGFRADRDILRSLQRLHGGRSKTQYYRRNVATSYLQNLFTRKFRNLDLGFDFYDLRFCALVIDKRLRLPKFKKNSFKPKVKRRRRSK